MSLRSCSDASAAAWITSSERPWHQLVTFGPSGFDAYARLRFLPDPSYDGQPESVLDVGGPAEYDLLRATLEVLRQHTAASDAVYFCVWDGWGPRGVPAAVLDSPRVGVPNRSYYLLRGSLSDFADWDPAGFPSGHQRLAMADPAFIWPADHAWCIAHDVDPHYAGIGSTAVAVAELLAHPGLDIVLSDPREDQPHYG